MSGIGGVLEDNASLIEATGEELASEGLEEVGAGKLGVAVSPAIWAYKYYTERETPHVLDIGLWVTGAVIPPAG